jgi:hypothetical protein
MIFARRTIIIPAPNSLPPTPSYHNEQPFDNPYKLLQFNPDKRRLAVWPAKLANTPKPVEVDVEGGLVLRSMASQYLVKRL